MDSMTIELAKQYNPQEAQQRWLKFWEEHRYFHSEPDNRPYFSIVIPPPNVTGALHMGHAMNNIPQDILTRWRRMQGYNAMWLPGTDHAGIATQAVVERRVREEEDKNRHDLGRDELVKRIWLWKDQYASRILRQLRELGCSCDWARTRFTLDEGLARAVRFTFFRLFRDGLIYRGKRLVNWDTQLQTAVADDETFHETVKGGFWTFRYPVKGTSEFIRFSTTRPETMLGDTAVAVHPEDSRYQHLIGKLVTIPLVNRDIPIIADGQLVDREKGTGAVKVTPAHDHNDYQCGLRHHLPMINILNPDGTINENGGVYAGLDRYKARERVTEDMERMGFFEGREDREIELAHSDRSKTPIEPYLSDQWFVEMGKLAQRAIDVVNDGQVKFFPTRYARSYLDWLGEKRDWCISRQLWWGHQIPVWYKEEPFPPGSKTTVSSPTPQVLLRLPKERWQNVACVGTAEAEGPEGLDRYQVCIAPGHEDLERLLEADGFQRDPDVLDTWFSSALWPHSTLGWPDQTPDLQYYYPTSVLVTNRDIISLWVVRMVVLGLYNTGKVPFHHVYIHPKMLDGFGVGMSKTKGNGIDPLDIVDKYGADALRFVIAQIAGETQDYRMPVSNVCPHCGELVPVKQEHMYMRTRKIACPKCKKPFRPGGPWPAEDAELPTAKQASDRFDIGRNFANKLWNAARFLLLNLEGYTSGPVKLDELPIEDRWILSRLATTVQAVTNQLEGYHFSDVARTIYDFTWSEFCDWYVEMSKGRLRDEAGRALAQRILVGVLDAILRLVHPIMPFVAESLWQALGEAAPQRGFPAPGQAAQSIAIAPWPALPASWQDSSMEHRIALMQELIGIVREVRNRYTIDPKSTLDVFVRADAAVAEDFRQLAPFITMLAGVGRLECGSKVTRPPQSSGEVRPEFEAYVSLKGQIDIPAEIKRLEKQIAEKRKFRQATEAKLANKSFVDKAPPEVVEQQRELVADLEKQIAALERDLAELKAA
jgi:valyl-tRNA synthetase